MRIFKRKNWLDSAGGQPDRDGNFRRAEKTGSAWLSLMIRNFLEEQKKKS